MKNENSLAPIPSLKMEKEGEFTAKKVILQISPGYFPTVPQRQQAACGKKW